MKNITHIIFEKIRIKHFLVIFVLSVPLSAFLLRQNNLRAIELRDKVLEVDEQTGDISQVAPHIEALGSYVLTHMNTNVGTVELPGSYNRAVEKLRAEAERSGNAANSAIYSEAQARCEDPNIPLTARAQCVQDYILANASPGSDPILELELPDKSLFSYSFASPTWSADWAGFSVLVTVMSGLFIIFLGLTRILARIFNRMIERDPLE